MGLLVIRYFIIVFELLETELLPMRKKRCFPFLLIFFGSPLGNQYDVITLKCGLLGALNSSPMCSQALHSAELLELARFLIYLLLNLNGGAMWIPSGFFF